MKNNRLIQFTFLIISIIFALVGLTLFIIATTVTDPTILTLFYLKWIAGVSYSSGFFLGLVFALVKFSVNINVDSNINKGE